MSSRAEEARSYYSEDVSMDSHSFLEMLLLDSCFIFHAFRLIICPLLYSGWPSDQIMLDLLMLENQIPFFVLVQLYCGLGGEQEFRKFAGAYAGTIIHYAVNSFTRCNMGSTWDDSILPEQVLQLLHLFRLSLGPCGIKSTLPPQRMNDFMGPSPRYVPSVTELQDRSAIEFHTRYSHSILDIRFHSGVMKIPFLELNDGNITILRNLIAFEQCCPQVEPGVTSYAAFIDCLIKTEDDANLLERSGILLNSLPTSSDAAFFFSKLSPRAEVRKSTYLDHILVDVNRYHNSKWNRWIRWYADLKLNYFSSPWLSLLMVAAAVLLILSFTQICYSVISYYHW
ncbi:UPF0481 protein At3g47200-like [Phoenix dactylifera]|uniref:UPF0481 protein At3g47200-like n=1 Tax=Phoenix dactylifera TaxID=42345 RepID=A0A8B7CGJ8_PHODC|nr:UPF0481 protein At3g47200-like [Phoenix dactylifera]